MTERTISFCKRKNYPFIKFNGQCQGKEQTCVFASIVGAINHLCNAPIWDIGALLNAHRAINGTRDFSVVKTALTRTKGQINVQHHNNDQMPLSIDQIAGWIDSGAIVIISLQISEDQAGTQRKNQWHMFTLISRDGHKFQVWDTNGRKGYFYEEELLNGFRYDKGIWCLPHKEANCLVLWAR